MDNNTRNIININRELIIKDLHGDVFDCLRKKGILNSEEFESITSLDVQEKRNGKFLEILLSKNDGLEHFMEALKEWYWWIEDKLRQSLKEKLSWEDSLASTNVPAIPLRNVSRTDLLDQVRKALCQLKKGHYVVLHGMSGCGKSSLAAESLHNDIFMEKFQGNVHWLSCGQGTSNNDENEILALMFELNEKISNEELVSDVKTATVQTLKVKLMKRFQKSGFKEGLVVLDGVSSANVIEALNIGCKTLVTTNDIGVMTNQGPRYTSIKVNEGFTEEESLEQLAFCVGLPVEKLPHHARKIHAHGKGHPLIMSLIGGQLESHKEEARNNEDSWKPYVDVLVNKEYGNLKRQSYEGNTFWPKTIELCINNLSADIREKFQDFALFVADVNIKAEVLKILWNLSDYEVKQIMDEFHKKSLIVRKYTKNFYVYGIHDILLYYLKKQLNKEAIKELHCKLINRYIEECKNDPSKFPRNDNYFFYYIGYHIANAELYRLFSEWYFNLDFIEGKLKVAGPGDLLLDYKRYSSYFSEDLFDSSVVANKVADFVRFVEVCGVDVRRNHGPDIVQLALQEPHDSAVYRVAKRVAQSRPHATYLRFQLGPSKSRSAPHLISKEKVSAACFSKGSDDVIVGFESGLIQIMTKKGYVTRVHEEHTVKVKKLSVSGVKNIFLSVSGNFIKIWKLPELDSSPTIGSGNRTPSPSQRQTDFTDIFTHKTVDKRKSWLSIEQKSTVGWACFSSVGSKMVSCCGKDSNDGKVEIREISEANPVLSLIRLHAACCSFSHDDQFLILGCSTSYIYVHSISNNHGVMKLVDSYPILALFPLQRGNHEVKFGALTKAMLSVWELEPVESETGNKKNSVHCLKDYNKQELETYVCCAAASDGTYVAVATSSGKILICDLSDGSKIREMDHSSGNIKYLAMDESREHRLLACYDDAIKIWTLGEKLSSEPAMMKTNFAVTWTSNQEFILVAPTYKPCIKKVFGQNKTEDLTIPEVKEINICGISKSGKYTTIGTSSGEVYLHFEDLKQEMIKILAVSRIITKLKVEVQHNTIFVVVGLDRGLKIWTCNEEDILQSNKAENFNLQLSDKLVKCFIVPNERLITVAENGSIKKWSLSTGKMESPVLVQARLDVTVCDAGLTSDSTAVTLDSRRNLLNMYRDLLGTMEEMKAELPGTPTCCSFSHSGNKLAVGFKDGLIQVWDASETLTLERELDRLIEAVQSVCVSRWGLVGAATEALVLLAPEDPVAPLGQAKLRVQRVLISPDDKTLLTVDSDGHMHLIDDFRNNANDGSLKREIAKLAIEKK